jgi:hypothetical protein
MKRRRILNLIHPLLERDDPQIQLEEQDEYRGGVERNVSPRSEEEAEKGETEQRVHQHFLFPKSCKAPSPLAREMVLYNSWGGESAGASLGTAPNKDFLMASVQVTPRGQLELESIHDPFQVCHVCSGVCAFS